jgi:hypothetical protein
VTVSISRLRAFFLFLGLFSTATASAAPGLPDLFADAFYSANYVENECRENIFRFLELANEKGADLRDVEIWMIEDYSGRLGQGVAGKQVRNPADPTKTREDRWDYHTVLFAEGTIYDFDFTNEPRSIEESAYWLEMYLTERERSNPATRLDKLGNYQITRYTAESYIRSAANGQRDLDQIQVIRLKDRHPELFPKF